MASMGVIDGASAPTSTSSDNSGGMDVVDSEKLLEEVAENTAKKFKTPLGPVPSASVHGSFSSDVISGDLGTVPSESVHASSCSDVSGDDPLLYKEIIETLNNFNNCKDITKDQFKDAIIYNSFGTQVLQKIFRSNVNNNLKCQELKCDDQKLDYKNNKLLETMKREDLLECISMEYIDGIRLYKKKIQRSLDSIYDNMFGKKIKVPSGIDGSNMNADGGIDGSSMKVPSGIDGSNMNADGGIDGIKSDSDIDITEGVKEESVSISSNSIDLSNSLLKSELKSENIDSCCISNDMQLNFKNSKEVLEVISKEDFDRISQDIADDIESIEVKDKIIDFTDMNFDDVVGNGIYDSILQAVASNLFQGYIIDRRISSGDWSLIKVQHPSIVAIKKKIDGDILSSSYSLIDDDEAKQNQKLIEFLSMISKPDDYNIYWNHKDNLVENVFSTSSSHNKDTQIKVSTFMTVTKKNISFIGKTTKFQKIQLYLNVTNELPSSVLVNTSIDHIFIFIGMVNSISVLNDLISNPNCFPRKSLTVMLPLDNCLESAVVYLLKLWTKDLGDAFSFYLQTFSYSKSDTRKVIILIKNDVAEAKTTYGMMENKYLVQIDVTKKIVIRSSFSIDSEPFQVVDGTSTPILFLCRLFKLIKLEEGDLSMDIGCGNGKVLALSTLFSQRAAIGVELGNIDTVGSAIHQIHKSLDIVPNMKWPVSQPGKTVRKWKRSIKKAQDDDDDEENDDDDENDEDELELCVHKTQIAVSREVTSCSNQIEFGVFAKERILPNEIIAIYQGYFKDGDKELDIKEKQYAFQVTNGYLIGERGVQDKNIAQVINEKRTNYNAKLKEMKIGEDGVPVVYCISEFEIDVGTEIFIYSPQERDSVVLVSR